MNVYSDIRFERKNDSKSATLGLIRITFATNYVGVIKSIFTRFQSNHLNIKYLRYGNSDQYMSIIGT